MHALNYHHHQQQQQRVQRVCDCGSKQARRLKDGLNCRLRQTLTPTDVRLSLTLLASDSGALLQGRRAIALHEFIVFNSRPEVVEIAVRASPLHA